MAKRMTITVDDEVYVGLRDIVGSRHISRFLNDLARPHVTKSDLDADYTAMAADTEREAEAEEWAEGVVSDLADGR